MNNMYSRGPTSLGSTRASTSFEPGRQSVVFELQLGAPNSGKNVCEQRTPDTPGNYLVRDEFGDVSEEIVLFTGVKLRKPSLRPKTQLRIRHSYADGPIARTPQKHKGRKFMK